jgi:hypothetical protein
MDLKPCGTYAAYLRHRRHGEKACDACQEAQLVYRAEQRRKLAAKKPPRALKPCGTYGAFQRHVKRGEDPDQACVDARNAYVAEMRRNNPNYLKSDKRRLDLRNRAIRRLIELHAADFAILQEDEWNKAREEGR